MYCTISAVTQTMRALPGSRRRIFQIFAIAAMLVAALPARSQTAQIAGVTTDQHGRTIAGAQVQITNTDTAYKTAVKTNEAGSYAAKNLPAGHYQVAISAPGFATAASAILTLVESQTLSYDVQLKVGSAQTTVNVVAQEGSAAVGYKMETTKAISVWGELSVLDTPYTVFGTSADLIQNYMAGNIDQIFKMNPLVSNNYDYDTFNRAGPTLRGNSTSSAYFNGVPGTSFLGVYTELYGSIDVFTGLSGFLYGAGPVGGFVNYNLKRPTSSPLYSLTLADEGSTSRLVHVDVSNKILSDKVGYRLNAVAQNGGTGVQNQSVSKWALSSALDIHATDKLLITLDAYAGDRWVHGRQAMFNLGASYKPIDGSKLYTPKNTFDGVRDTFEDVGATYKINEHIDLRGTLQHKHADSPEYYPQVIQVNPGTPQIQPETGNVMAYVFSGGYGYLDAHFDTFKVKHNITAGVNGYHQTGLVGIFNCPNNMSAADPTGDGSGYTYTEYCVYNYTEPVSNGTGLPDGSAGGAVVPNMFQYYMGIEAKSSLTRYTSMPIGDDIQVNRWIQILAGETLATVTSQSFNFANTAGTALATNTLAASYSKEVWTPNYSLIVKPQPWASIYETYIQSLSPGTTAPATYTYDGGTYSYFNGNQVLPPVRNHEFETGIKTEIKNRLLATIAYYHTFIATYGSSNPTSTTGAYYIQSGRQLTEGLEFTAQGKITKDLSVVGGGTHAHYIYRNETSFAQDGTEPAQTPTDTQKVTLEYATPFLKSLIVTGGVYHTGEQYAESDNEGSLSGYTLIDLGGRYSRKVYDHDLTFRVNSTNLSNAEYWPDSRTPGMPRLVMFSTTFKY